MNIPAELNGIVSIDPGIHSGDICFVGTRVPLATFIDYITVGSTMEEFLDGFPGVSAEQANAALHWLGAAGRSAIGLAEAS